MKTKSFDRGSLGLPRRSFLKLGAAAGAASLGLGAPALAQAPRQFRLGHNLPVATIYHRAGVMFAEEVARLSSNAMQVAIFPSSQLGPVSEMLQSVQAGSLTMAYAVPAWYSNFMRPMDVFSLPYLIASDARLRTALEGRLGQEISVMADKVGFKMLGYLLIGPRHIINRVRPINKPADTQGLKIRVINSQVYIQSFQALGATPVAMDAAEIYLALQQGAIDGFETALPDVVAFKWFEVSKFISLDAHTTDFFPISFHKGTWDGLSAEQRGIFEAAMKKAADFQWKGQPEDIAAALEKLKTLVQVNDIAPADKELFVKATRPVYEKFQATIGKDFLDLAIKELS